MKQTNKKRNKQKKVYETVWLQSNVIFLFCFVLVSWQLVYTDDWSEKIKTLFVSLLYLT